MRAANETNAPVRRYAAFLRREAWLILLVPALTIAVAASITLRQTPTYRASTTLVVRQLNPGQGGDFGSPQLLQTMTNLLVSDVVVRGAIKDFGLKMTTAQFLKQLLVTHNPDSAVMEVSYDTTNKRAAVPILSEVAKDFQNLVDDKLGPQPGVNPTKPGLPVVSAEVFNTPHLESGVVSPRPARTLAFAGVLGLAVGLLIAFLREGLDERVRSRADAEEWFDAPVIGTLPKVRRKGRGVSVDRSELGGAIEVLRANFLFSQNGSGGPSVLITSAMPSEGKSLVAANLALALGMAGEDVIIADADLRRPSLHRKLGVEKEANGLFDILTAGVDVEDALQDVRFPVSEQLARRTGPGREGMASPSVVADEQWGRLRALTAGKSSGRAAISDPAGILTRDRVDDLLQRLRSQCELLVVDGPPLLVADAFPFAVEADRVLIVAQQGRTSRDKAQAARATLAGLGVERVSVVLTNAASAAEYRYG